MTQVSGTNEKFLTREFIVPKIFQILSPNLFWLDLVNKTKTDSRSITFKKETYSDADDPKKKKTRARTPSAQWTYVGLSGFETDNAVLGKNGFAMRIDENAIDYTEGIDEIQRGIRKMAYWLGEDLSARIGGDIVAGATTPSWSPAAPWSDVDNRTPVEDLRLFKKTMRRPGYAYRLTDTIIHLDNLDELEGYLLALDANQDIRAKAYGYPEINGDSINVPIVGNIQGVENGIPEGAILGLDRNNPAATMWYNNSPRYATKQISYDIYDSNGNKQKKTINNFGFNFNQYTDPDTHEVVLQMWFDIKTVVNEPYGVIYKSTGL
jgi:hypothetical protein